MKDQITSGESYLMYPLLVWRWQGVFFCVAETSPQTLLHRMMFNEFIERKNPHPNPPPQAREGTNQRLTIKALYSVDGLSKFGREPTLNVTICRVGRLTLRYFGR